MTASIDWNKYLIESTLESQKAPVAPIPVISTQTQVPQAQVPQQEEATGVTEQKSPIQWDQFEVKEPETGLQQATRFATGVVSDWVAQTLGLPGDIGALVESIAPGDKENPLRQLATWASNLPGSQSIKEGISSLTGGYTSPQEGLETSTREALSTLSSLISPVPGVTTAARTAPVVIRHAANALASQLAKEGVKLLGGSEGQQEDAKMLSLFVGGMALPRIAERSPDAFVSKVYQKRDALIPNGTMVEPVKLSKDLNSFIEKLKKGIPTAEKRAAIAQAEELLTAVNNRAVPLKEMTEMQRNLNRNMSDLYTKDLSKSGVKAARANYGEIAAMLNNSVEGFIGTVSPNAVQLHRQAQAAYSTLSQSRVVTRFITKQLESLPAKTAVGMMFGGAAMHPIEAVMALPKAAATAAVAGGIKTAAEVTYRVLKDPTLRMYYFDVLTGAMKENAPAVIRSLNKLDAAMYKQMSSPDYHLSDEEKAKKRRKEREKKESQVTPNLSFSSNY